jgi:uncharacterized protein (DUF2249 family)
MLINSDRSDLPVSAVSLASSAADSDALDRIRSHHAELVGGLTARTSGLLSAVRRGDGWEGARDGLVAWCRNELLPHAEAEEAVLYRAALGLSALEPLVRSMSYEHALLGDLVARLATADDAPAALVHAGATMTLFEAHVAKENDLLLPAMVAAHDVSVAQLLAEMDTLPGSQGADGAAVSATAHQQPTEASHGHTCGCHDEASVAPELDARVIPHAIRHATIFGALGAVAPASQLILVAPHDPLPLLHQIEQRWPAAFDIDYLERGPDAWRLRLTRTPTESVA